MKQWITKSKYVIYQFISGRSNVFAISNGERFLLIDTSVKKSKKELCKKIDQLIATEKMEALILTHEHYDHVANACYLKGKYKTTLIAQRNAITKLALGDSPLPSGTNWATKLMVNLGKRLGVNSLMRYQPVEVDIVVEEEYDLHPYGFNAYIHHTPGHTEGCLSVIVDDEIVIVGDAMFGVFNHSIYPPFAMEPKRMVKSWKRLLDTGCYLFLPSHGTKNSRELVFRQYKKYRKKKL